MPFFQSMLSRLNKRFDPEGVREVPAELFDGGLELHEVAKELHVATEKEAQVIRDIPGGMKEALRALIRNDLLSEPPLPITFAWAPGYDYELTIWETPGIPSSPGGITVLLKSRYPDDTHPSIRR
jgi:hypothetical protein